MIDSRVKKFNNIFIDVRNPLQNYLYHLVFRSIMTNQTEVIDSTHIVTSEDMDDHDQKSPLYTDPEVTQQERAVRFWNTASFSDTDIQSGSRKARAGIDVDGSITWTSWHNYSSPATSENIFQPETEFVVPYTGSDHEYDVKTHIQVEELDGVVWNLLYDRNVGPYTATVKET